MGVMTACGSKETADTEKNVKSISDNSREENDTNVSDNNIEENIVGISENSLECKVKEAEKNEYEYADFAFADVDDYVNVRNQPSTEGAIVGKIYDGAVAQILAEAGEEGDWYQIVSGNVEGYIKSEFFLRGEEAASVMDKYVTQYARVKADRLNVRKEASIDSERIGYVSQDEKIKVIEKEGEWVKVQYTEEKTGYVSAEYVVISEEFVYARTLEEEAEEEQKKKERESREQDNAIEIINVEFPTTVYASNEELRRAIVDYAMQYVGNRYKSGGSSLTSGTDCSGFTCFIYADFGYSISRTPSGQFSGSGRSIEYSTIQPGDIICYSSNGGKSCTHVGLYIGDGQIVHSANSRKGVVVQNADYDKIIGIKNVID